jgi:hypothetical protein
LRRASTLLFDTTGDGTLWVRGASYKASFDAHGACVIPSMGASAPRNRPVRFTIDAASVGGVAIAIARSAEPVRDGSSIVYDRAGFVEKYAVDVSALEQTLTFADLPARGALRLRLNVDTDLDVGVDADGGLRFACAEGGLRYGRATAIDANGRTAPIETRVDGGAIELAVPASFVNDATLPLTIDPVISTFAIDEQPQHDYTPDVAYDPSTDRYMVCYEEEYSSTDHDVYEELLDASGNVISGAYIDITTDNWQHPRIANNARASQFMVVAQVGAAPSRAIRSRTASAGTNTLGSQVTVSSAFASYDQLDPDIGGNPGNDPDSLYLVVWEFLINQTGERDIVQIGMHTTGLPDSSAAICIDCQSTSRDFHPAISKSCGSTSGLTDRWTVVWEFEYSATDHDIYGAQQVNELLVAGPYAIDASVLDDRRPTVSSFAESSSSPGNYLVAWDRHFSSDNDILGQVMNGAASVASASLSSLEGPTFYFQNQIAPSADSDGCTFAVAYQELYGSSTTDYDAYIATFNLAGNAIDCIEPHANLAYSGLAETDVRISAARGPSSMRTMAAWTRQFTGNDDIEGGLYDAPSSVPYCVPSSNGVGACPCNNPPQSGGGCNNSVGTGGAVLTASGTPSLASDSLALAQSGELPNALSIFLQGTANVASGTLFGDGVRCVGGSLKRLFVHNASLGQVGAPVGSDSSVSARSAALGDTIPSCATRYYQVYYRDSNLAFCTGGFNVGNGLKAFWMP